MRIRAVAVLVAIAAACGTAAPARLGAQAARLKVIAHPSRAADLSSSDLRAIYLKQRRLWGDGEAILPVNRDAGSAARERFSQLVFGQSTERLADYWNRRYYEAGEFPPATLASEEAVIRFVATHPNALGYVTTESPGDSVVVVLELE